MFTSHTVSIALTCVEANCFSIATMVSAGNFVGDCASDGCEGECHSFDCICRGGGVAGRIASVNQASYL